ncbi:MAG TPA: zinc ribbon domain-containing protein [Aggregatilineales bacterium]|nr:zinc ribbon domain-containing protein [Aggregatilineales bacterium]
MEPITALLALAAVLFVGAFIVQPFFNAEGGERAGRERRRAASALRQRADLLAERNRVYAAIRDLDFDYKTNKVSDEEYAEQRYRLVAECVEILQMLDALPADDPDADPLEAMIARYRRGEGVVLAPEPAPARAAAARAARYCPRCGAAAQAGDRFCGSCGTRL